ncbi:MAG TPA: hypothetical protein VJH20_05755 [Candidatus Nanoarchaeia archaeon]|nr:hypothetical protein [Candidatus Nanoarchaeia archaeon]
MAFAMGSWAFLLGVILAVLFGFVGEATWVPWVLVLLGLIVGLLNITDKEVTPFLTAGVILVITSSLGGNVLGSIGVLGAVLENMLTLFVPATIIVALKSVFSLAKSK